MSNLKKMIRARMELTGESYQTAQRHVRAGAPMPSSEQTLTAFANNAATFSDQCRACYRWIWCGKAARVGVCVCGQQYRVEVVDREPNWELANGIRCTECGAQKKLTLASEDRNPWRVVKEGQLICNGCSNATSTPATPLAAYVLVRIPTRISRRNRGKILPREGGGRLFARITIIDEKMDTDRREVVALVVRHQGMWLIDICDRATGWRDNRRVHAVNDRSYRVGLPDDDWNARRDEHEIKAALLHELASPSAVADEELALEHENLVDAMRAPLAAANEAFGRTGGTTPIPPGQDPTPLDPADLDALVSADAEVRGFQSRIGEVIQRRLGR